MEGKSPQQLREMFNIVNDFRGEEEGITNGKWSEDPNARACLEGRMSSCSHGGVSKTTSSQTGPKNSRKQLRRKQNGVANGAKVTSQFLV